MQDNWKVNSRLTLDYGMRFSLIYPQYDKREQDYYFVPSKFDPAKAVRLYRPTCDTRARSLAGQFCSSQHEPARFRSGQSERAASGLFGRAHRARIRRSVQWHGGSKNGNFPGGIKSRGVQYGPVLGFAYDVFGNSKTVLRGGYRLGFDRVQGNELAFAAVGQPPLFFNPTFNFGNLSTVGQSTGQHRSWRHQCDLRRSGGTRPQCSELQSPSATRRRLEHRPERGICRHALRHQQELLNLNYSPYGELFTAAAQDPSRFAER